MVVVWEQFTAPLAFDVGYKRYCVKRGFTLSVCTVFDTTFSGSLRKSRCSSSGNAANSWHAAEQQPLNAVLQSGH